MSDQVDHPSHYGGADNPYEAIRVIRAWGVGFELGNTIKYIARAGRKPGADVLTDLKKAAWYLAAHIERIEGRQVDSDAESDASGSGSGPAPHLGGRDDADALDPDPATIPPPPPDDPEPLTILYRNYRGETATRNIIPRRIYWGTELPWHPEPGWLIVAHDCDKQAERTFAWEGIIDSQWVPEMTPALAELRDKAIDDHRAGLTEPMDDLMGDDAGLSDDATPTPPGKLVPFWRDPTLAEHVIKTTHDDLTRAMESRDEARAECVALRGEVERLRAAIREHRDCKHDDRCHLDDQKLYAVLGDGVADPADCALPPMCDFLASCQRFWRQRQAPGTEGTARLPGDMTIAELTAEVERLRAARSEANRACPFTFNLAPFVGTPPGWSVEYEDKPTPRFYFIEPNGFAWTATVEDLAVNHLDLMARLRDAETEVRQLVRDRVKGHETGD